MSDTGNVRFVGLATDDGRGSAKSRLLSSADRRHVRLTTLKNAHNGRSVHSLRKQKDHESSFQVTNLNNWSIGSNADRSTANQALMYPREYQAAQHTKHLEDRPLVTFDRISLKNGSSLDEHIATPRLAHDLNFLQHVLETNADYALLRVAYQHDAFLYGLLAMTKIYKDSAQGIEATSHSLLYKGEAMKRIIPLLAQKLDLTMDVRVATVAALATIELVETYHNATNHDFSVSEKGLRAAVDARRHAMVVSGHYAHPDQAPLDRATEWILLMFSMLSSDQIDNSSTCSNERDLRSPGIQVKYEIIEEISRIFRDIGEISSAVDKTFANATTLQFSLANSAATEDLGMLISDLERSVAQLPLAVTSDTELRHLLETIKFTLILYINVFIRHVPKSAAINNILAVKALQFLRALLPKELRNRAHLLRAHGRFSLFVLAVLHHYLEATISHGSVRDDAKLRQLEKVLCLLCEAQGVDTPDTLLSIIQTMTKLTERAHAEIKESLELCLKK